MSNQKQPVPLPASMKEAFELGYCYSGGDGFADDAEFRHDDNVCEWTGEMEWDVYDPTDTSGTDLPHIHTKVRARFEFLAIEEGQAKLKD